MEIGPSMPGGTGKTRAEIQLPLSDLAALNRDAVRGIEAVVDIEAGLAGVLITDAPLSWERPASDDGEPQDGPA